MKKFVSVFLLSLMLVSVSVSYANPSSNETLSQKEVVQILENIDTENSPIIKKPEELNVSTTSNTIVISGKGREKEKVIIELYYKVKDDYVFDKQPIEVTLGPLGVFSKEVAIKNSFGSSTKELFVLVKIQRKNEWIVDARKMVYSDISDIKKSLENIRKP